MHKIVFLAAAAAVSLAGVGAWLASATHARVSSTADVRIDPMWIMTQARDIPVEFVVDLSSFD
jgi:hypothetical protein